MFTDPGSEELVVATMKAGLSDYVLKKHLRTLPQVVSHCVEEAQLRQERDTALVELAESERRFRTIANLVIHYAFSVLFDQNNRAYLTWVSPSITRRLDYTLEEILHQRSFLARFVIREDWPTIQAIFDQVRAGGAGEFTLRIRTSEGELRWVQLFCTPRFDKSGETVIKGDGAARDITEPKAAENALKAQMARLSLLNQVARAILERHDLASMYQAVLLQIENQLPLSAAWIAESGPNTLEILGETKRGRAVRKACLPSGSRLRVSARVAELLANGQTITLHDPKDVGRELGLGEPLSCNGRMVLAPLEVGRSLNGVLLAAREHRGFSSGEAAFIRGVAEHLSLAWKQAKLHETLELAYRDLRQTQAAMLQQERLRALGQMASGIAHDINNALSPVSLYASTMLLDPALPDKHRRAAKVILDAVDSAAKTLRRLKDFYRTAPTEVLESVAGADLVVQVVELTRPKWRDMAQEHGVRIDIAIDLEPNLPPLYGSPSELRDALTNLILNAVDAMPEGGNITIRARTLGLGKPGTHLVLEVQDEGVGMDEETRTRALEPFFTTKTTGTGMGLAMVYGVVQRHGGDVEIESWVGRGTTVRLILPFREPEAAPVEEPGAAELPSLRILLVDDEPLIREALGHALRMDGHDVDAADSGPAALELFDKAIRSGQPYHVVITDLGMPEMDGRQLAEKIKSLAPATPVVILSGWGMVLRDKEERYADAIVSKPPNVELLKRTIARLLARAQGSSPSPPQ